MAKRFSSVFVPAGDSPISKQRFVNLNQITETDRQQYMQQLSEEDDYGAEFEQIITKITSVVGGMNMVEKANETPILNDKRGN